MKTQPELEAFEAELKKYMAIETEVSNISPVYNIGKHLFLHSTAPSTAAEHSAIVTASPPAPLTW